MTLPAEVLLLRADPRDAAALAEPRPPAEFARAARFRREVDRSRSLVTATLLRRAVTQLTEEPDPSVGRWCRTCGELGDHGRPVVLGGPAGVHLAAAHAGDVVLVAATSAGPVGVDVEAAAGFGEFPGYDEEVLTEAERCSSASRARTWTRKEAVLKATGHGLAVDPVDLCTAGWPGSVRWPTALDGDLVAGGYRLVDLDPAVGHVGALCLLTSGVPEVRWG